MPTSTSKGKVTVSVPIILLGSTGCGKSSFINAAVGKQVAAVGAGMQPTTNKIARYPLAALSRGSINVQCVLVDTPGFGFNPQHHRWEGTTDIDNLRLVEATFKDEMEEGQWGVIFLHDSCAGEVDWEAEQRTMAVFTRLAGGDALRNLTVVAISPHEEAYTAVETGLLKDLRDRGIQPICSSSFGDPVVAHPQCEDVQTPRQIIEHVVSLALARKAEAGECDSNYPSSDDIHIYSPSVAEEESVIGWNEVDGSEQPLDGGSALLSPYPSTAPLTVVHISHSTFNDIAGNQTNNYGRSETSQAPSHQASQQDLGDPRGSSQQNFDNPWQTSQQNLENPCRTSQQNLHDPRQASQQNLDDMHKADDQALCSGSHHRSDEGRTDKGEKARSCRSIRDCVVM
ncbi:hypothetical protein BKA70DRAFT_1266327 [Coprinopsis sp. MPI-PUGE-AT-0042]|nr:hypothetical protein BKA70DRAFT_1266327 [Coprinopsis sp. MPI-PUGE-AT-0042]